MRLVLAAAVLALAVGAGCGDDDPPESTAGTKTIEITFADGTVTPNGERVSVERGQRIELVVKADTGGELHLHTSPEQELTYSEGTTTFPLVIDTAGVVDVEAHDLDQVVVQLQVE